METTQTSPLIKNDNAPQSTRTKTCVGNKLIIFLIVILILTAIIIIIYFLVIEDSKTDDSPTATDIADFIKTIDGDVYQVSDSQYQQILFSIWNQRHQFNPLLIVLPLNSSDIMKTINFTGKFSLSFSILGGGHNSVGWNMNNGGIVLSMQYFKNISTINVNNNITALSIGAGNRWYNVYNYMIDNGLSSYIITGGICPQVGVVGFTLGGGINGISSREFGLNIDNILEYKLIIANGTEYTLNNETTYMDSNLENLVWGLKGVGGNNLGIVTNIIVKLNEPNSDNRYILLQYISLIVYNSTYNNIDNVIDLLVFYNELQYNLPRYIAMFITFNFTDNNLIFNLRIGCNNNKSVCDNLLETFYFYLNNTNIIYTFEEKYDYYVDAMCGYTNESINNYNNQQIYIKSGYISSDNGLEFDLWNRTLYTMTERMYYPYNLTNINFEQLGGRVSDVGNQDTAYYHRENIDWVCQIKGTYYGDDDIVRKGIDWINILYSNVYEYFFGSYVNYMDEYLDEWEVQYYGNNYNKLQCIKQTYDPFNFFHFDQSIQINQSLSCI